VIEPEPRSEPDADEPAEQIEFLAVPGEVDVPSAEILSEFGDSPRLLHYWDVTARHKHGYVIVETAQSEEEAEASIRNLQEELSRLGPPAWCRRHGVPRSFLETGRVLSDTDELSWQIPRTTQLRESIGGPFRIPCDEDRLREDAARRRIRFDNWESVLFDCWLRSPLQGLPRRFRHGRLRVGHDGWTWYQGLTMFMAHHRLPDFDRVVVVRNPSGRDVKRLPPGLFSVMKVSGPDGTVEIGLPSVDVDLMTEIVLQQSEERRGWRIGD
jgi:hypothetical protein